MSKEQELISMGWKKRSTHDEPRLSEMVITYEELGLEVHMEPFHPEQEEGCSGCMTASAALYRTIYTRKKP